LYNKIRAGDWWNRTEVAQQDVSSYNIIIVINRKSDVKPDESILGKAYNEYLVGIFYYYYYSSYLDIQICGLASQHTYIHI